MRRPPVFPRLVLSVGLVCLSAAAARQLAMADWIVVRTETLDCTLDDTSPRLHTVTVLHKFNAGSVASRFKVELDPGVTMTYLSETIAWPTSVGDFRNGISICYGSCQVGDVVLGTIEFQGYGTSAPCSFVRVVPHPDAETLEAIDCDNQPDYSASTLHLGVGAPGQDCFCNPHTDPTTYPGTPMLFDCQALPGSSTTWGAIKALYR